MRADKKDAEYYPDLPPVRAAEHLLGYLFDAGPTAYGGAITHGELWFWQKNIGIEIEPWEVRMLRRLSNDYLVMAHEATRADCPVPWSLESDLNATAKKLKLAIRNIAAL